MTYRIHLSALAVALGLTVAACGSSDPEPMPPPDPSKNTAIASTDGADQVQPKIVAASDGGWWVSWFSNNRMNPEARGYRVYLQRLGASGKPQLAPQGVEVAKLSLNSTQDYGLIVDPLGNASLTFQDDRPQMESPAITVTQLNGAGSAQWERVLASSGNAPQIAHLPNGHALVGWTVQDDSTQYSSVRIQRLDGSGEPVWKVNGVTQDLVISEPGFGMRLGELRADGTGAVIASFVRGNFPDGDLHLYANKIDANGQLLWGQGHLKVFDGAHCKPGMCRAL